MSNCTVAEHINHLQRLIEENPEAADMPIKVRGFGQHDEDDHDINSIITAQGIVTLSANYYGA